MIAQSTETAELFAALVEAGKGFGDAVKDRQNPQLKNNYATIGSIFDAVEGPLAKQGLRIIQTAGETSGPPGQQAVTVTTQIIHRSGQWIRSTSSCAIPTRTPTRNDPTPDRTLPPQGINEPQAYGIAVTYLRRYAVLSMMCIAQEEARDAEPADDDADGCTPEPRREARTQEAERAAEPEAERPFDPQAFVRSMAKLDPAWTAEAVCAVGRLASLDELTRARALAAYEAAKAGKIKPPTPTNNQPADDGGEDEIP